MRKEYDFSEARRGPVLSDKGKTRITIYLDNDVIEAFRDRAETMGMGYQTLINRILRQFAFRSDIVLDESTLRKVIREELKAIG